MSTKSGSIHRQPIVSEIGIMHSYIIGFMSLKQLVTWYLRGRHLTTRSKGVTLLLGRNNGNTSAIEKIYSYTDSELDKEERRRIENKTEYILKGLWGDTYKDYLKYTARRHKREVFDFLKNKDVKYFCICKARLRDPKAQ